jgi:hypothetical protein
VNKTLQKELEKLAVKLKSCKADQYELKAFQYFDYLSWVDDKI